MMSVTPGEERHFEKLPAQVVVIAGSAGSLAPLKTIIGALPKETDAAYLVLVHRSAEPPFMLASILGQRARLPVDYAKSGKLLLAGRVYIAPPGERHLVVQSTMLRLVSGPKVGFHRPAADVLFASVAEAFGERATAVVLSGGGANGVSGLTRILDHGGRVLVQSPEEAEHDSMPRHALRIAPGAMCASAAELGAWLAAHAITEPKPPPAGVSDDGVV